MGKIFYIMGKSASGKDHIYARLAKNQNLNLKKLILYTTRPIRAEEEDGKQYFFVDDKKLKEFRRKGCLIEARSYKTVYGIWTYFTADDGQVNLQESDYLGIGTLESYMKLKKYYGEEAICPIYIEVEDGERLERALKRERIQEKPKYEEMCRRFLADQGDFSEENILKAGIWKRFQNVNLDECVEEIINYIVTVKK
ncbi:MAG: guanylate kinase [Clostridia bacterium]|nr:guanylate kinase [Clostridia bacterium]MDY5662871.1 guanylate kinase [Blautia sp.]